MDRHRGDRSGDGGGGVRRSRTPPRWSSGSPTRHHQRYPRGGGGEGFYGGRHHPYHRASPDYPPAGGSGGFRGGFGHPPPVRDHSHGNKYVKLFIGSVPRTATEDDVRPLFEEHGNVMEVAFAKDKRTGQQQGCCFVRYATSEEADRAIRALHNQYTYPGESGPIQVRYADGERERNGPAEDKLFVASLNKQATAKEVEEIFSQFGRVEDVYIVRDGSNQSRGFGFVKFSDREMAAAAITALNEKYVMRGCDQPLILRFAEPKRSRPREPRAGPAVGGPCFSPRSEAPSAIRPTANLDEPRGPPLLRDAWHPSSPKSLGLSSQSTNGSSGIPATKGGVAEASFDVPGTFGGTSGSANGSLPSLSGTPLSLQQVFNPSMLQLHPVVGQQISTLQKPLMFPQNIQYPLQLHHNLQHPGLQLQAPNMQAPLQQYGQLLAPQSGALTSYGQSLPSQQLPGLGAQLSTSQPLIQNSAAANVLQTPFNLRQQAVPAVASIPQFPATQQLLQQPILEPPPQSSHVLLQQQTHALQSSFHASQLAICQLQQQLQLMQQPSLNQHPTQTDKQQSAWTGQPSISVTPTRTAIAVMPSTMSATASIGGTTSPAVLSTCNWTEHTSPEGFKYYYNKVTCESKWEKPEEFALLEQQQQQQKLILSQQQQQKLAAQQLQSPPQTQLNKQIQLAQQVSQEQQAHSQMQTRQQAQLQLFQSSTLGFNFVQSQPASSVIDPTCIQQGIRAGQELGLKDKLAGS